MQSSLFIGATGMEAQRVNIDVISNNLANVNTSGFKRSRADFQELMYQTNQAAGSETAAGTEVPTGIQIGLGVEPASVQKIFQQGGLTLTDNPLDLAIEGDGFFQILLPDGETGYTRAGNFKLDSEGQIVNSEGNPMEPSITIPSNTLSITITSDGTVSALEAGNLTPTTVGQIELARFTNPGGLQAMGKNIFMPSGSSGSITTATPGSDGLGSVNQGFVEMSNVNIVEEMVNMIVSQRAYELNSKVVQTSDQMLQMANNIIR
ncbi:MAG: flagellar basal-body rod protein FlgG [Nitrospira bacterium SG8_35_1]|nr:MAG: flagellar basal-body rod protein FlgG [Nitrospira bacterium SG8_35_1]